MLGSKRLIALFDGLEMNNNDEAIENSVPELPNALKFIQRYLGSDLGEFLHDWDSIIFSVVIATLISLFFYFGTRNPQRLPTGLQNFLELLVDSLRKIVISVIGPEGEKYVPFLGTLFIYIFTMNIAGMVPLMKSPSSNINITAGLAICVFVLVQFLNFRNMGIGGFLYHLAGSPKSTVEWLIVPLMFPIEILLQLSRPVTLALRLFGNVLGEDILIAAFTIFGITLLSSFNSPVGLPLQLPFMFLGLLTSLMQALVFTLLSTVYIMLSMPHHEENNTHNQSQE